MLYLIYHYGYFCPSISKQKTGETMKLKNRMVISFFVIILVPLILTGVAVTGFTMYQVWSLEKKYGIEGVTYENLIQQYHAVEQNDAENILHSRENSLLRSRKSWRKLLI